MLGITDSAETHPRIARAKLRICSVLRILRRHTHSSHGGGSGYARHYGFCGDTPMHRTGVLRICSALRILRRHTHASHGRSSGYARYYGSCGDTPIHRTGVAQDMLDITDPAETHPYIARGWLRICSILRILRRHAHASNKGRRTECVAQLAFRDHDLLFVTDLIYTDIINSIRSFQSFRPASLHFEFYELSETDFCG